MTDDMHYNNMKDIWIKNMSINGSNNMELYFIYGKNNNGKQTERIVGDIYNFYGKNKETLYNVLKKTLDFMKYIDDIHNEYIIIRSNASTLFNLPLLKHHMNHLTTFKYAISGTLTSAFQNFPNGISEELIFISGTNLCLSQECVILITAWNFYKEIKEKIECKLKQIKNTSKITLLNINSLQEEIIS